MNKQRIGVYGGTFDPIHNGHLQVADAVIKAFRLDRMLFVPAYVPPHKRQQTVTSAFHRLSMLVLATAEWSKMYISTIELEAPERPYTIETLSRLKTELGNVQLFFVMGADSFRDIRMWYEYERILTEYDCIVAARPGACSNSNPRELSAHLAQHLQSRIVDLRGNRQPIESEARLGANEKAASPRVYLTDYVAVDVSGTGLRQAIRRGEGIEGQVPPTVAAYIAKYGLYQ